MAGQSSDIDARYGFTAVAADASKTAASTTSPEAVTISALQIPTSPLARRIDAYARAKLPAATYRHSLRVYSYGVAMARQCFPQFRVEAGSTLEETWFLAAMLHDIGTAPDFFGRSKLSFEFWGAFHALEVLGDSSMTDGLVGGGSDVDVDVDPDAAKATAPREQAESVAEAIIRHQDVQDKGFITLVTRLIHLGTLLDNIGAGQELVHPDTIRNVNEAYDRSGWSGCFRDTVVREKELKGWAMVSRIEGFEDDIEANGKGLMEPWEKH